MQSPFLMTSWVTCCLNGLKLRGWNVDLLMEKAGVNTSLLQEAQYPVDKLNAILECASDVYNAPDAGIEARRGFTPNGCLSVSHAVMSSPNLRDGLAQMVKFNAGLTNYFNFFLSDDAESVQFGFSIDPILTSYPMLCDAALGTVIKTCRFIQPRPVEIIAVDMARPKPEHTDIYAAYFKAPIHWNAKRYAIHFNPDYLLAPSIHANQTLMLESERLAAEYFASIQTKSVIDVLTHYLENVEDLTNVGLDSAAQHLHMGTRSLQRKLSTQGVSFNQVLEGFRKRRARHQLIHSSDSITQIGCALGFKDTGNFCRAFKRWFEITPGEFRLRNQAIPYHSAKAC